MTAKQGVLVINQDTFFKGSIGNCSQIDIYGFVEGELQAGTLVIHPGGTFLGKAKLDAAEVRGRMQGDAVVKNLFKIASTGDVTGNVQYGRLALENGGNLSAEVRNIPPRVTGDFELAVDKGRAARITLEDISAVDPDDDAADLKFSVSNTRNGFIILFGKSDTPVTEFTQADLAAGRVLFKHKGTDTTPAGFDIVVMDKSGATSGAAQSVKVSVRGAR